MINHCSVVCCLAFIPSECCNFLRFLSFSQFFFACQPARLSNKCSSYIISCELRYRCLVVPCMQCRIQMIWFAFLSLLEKYFLLLLFWVLFSLDFRLYKIQPFHLRSTLHTAKYVSIIYKFFCTYNLYSFLWFFFQCFSMFLCSKFHNDNRTYVTCTYCMGLELYKLYDDSFFLRSSIAGAVNNATKIFFWKNKK